MKTGRRNFIKSALLLAGFAALPKAVEASKPSFKRQIYKYKIQRNKSGWQPVGIEPMRNPASNRDITAALLDARRAGIQARLVLLNDWHWGGKFDNSHFTLYRHKYGRVTFDAVSTVPKDEIWIEG